MPASPIDSGLFYRDEDDSCQILQPTTEYSKLLKASYNVKKRVGSFKAVFDHVNLLELNVSCCVQSIADNAPTVFLLSGAAVDVLFTKSGIHTTFQVDFHDEWRKAIVGDFSVPVMIEVAFGPNGFKTYCITKSGTFTFNTSKCGDIERFNVIPSKNPHARLLKAKNTNLFKAEVQRHRPSNGQVWTYKLSPLVVGLAPFCFSRGWVCLTCNAAFDNPTDFLRHVLHNPGLKENSIILNRVDHHTGKQLLTSASRPKYPLTRPQHMSQHAYIGFNYHTAVHKLLELRKKKYNSI